MKKRPKSSRLSTEYSLQLWYMRGSCADRYSRHGTCGSRPCKVPLVISCATTVPLVVHPHRGARVPGCNGQVATRTDWSERSPTPTVSAVQYVLFVQTYIHIVQEGERKSFGRMADAVPQEVHTTKVRGHSNPPGAYHCLPLQLSLSCMACVNNLSRQFEVREGPDGAMSAAMANRT
jgi:hypothetical protein